ncbi:ATP-binding protein [Pedobacter nyackensis]|uniref:HD domain-containing protein n=1 Tax=Pedobacter nyackensis TaxID=475255 RepID=UPI002930526E|nr:ATP-binding protein [Pedobacter nyackensis]
MIEDTWRVETQLQLETSAIYKEFKLKAGIDPAGKQVLGLVDDTVQYAFQATKTVLIHMGEYTLHDGDHLFRVLKLMEKIVPPPTIQLLSVPELLLLILTAFFHDIGMAASNKDVSSWASVWNDELFRDESDEQYLLFKKYCQGFPSIMADIEFCIASGNLTKAGLLQKHLISEYIRSTHAERARSIIESEWEGKIKYRDIDLTNEFAQLCFSHNDDASTLLDMDTSLLCGPGVYACLPFVGVVLRLADILDFDAKRTPPVLLSHLFVRNPVSIREWQKHRNVDAWDINSTIIRFQARCEHPAIEVSIREFCNLIDRELATSNTILNRLVDSIRNPFPEHYKINLPLNVDRTKIGPRKMSNGRPFYTYQETKFTLNKKQVIDLLMGTKLYGQPDVALRELIQNSIDACLLRKAMAESWKNPYRPQIIIKYYKTDGDYLVVSDNGTGMDLDIVNRYYSSVGTSYYKSSEFYELKAKVNLEYTPISKFGIGVLSCFMVSDSLKVNTKRLKGPYESGEALEIIVEGQDSVFWVREGMLTEPGTSTELILRAEHPWRFYDDNKFIESICKLIPHPPFPIIIETGTRTETHTGESFKNLSLDDLRDYYWKQDANIRELSFDISNNDYGIYGKGMVAILDKKGTPVSEISLTAKEVNVDGTDYTLDKAIKYNTNEIRKTSTTIEIDESGEPQLSNSSNKLAASKAIIALHGIEVPFDLFPDYWSAKNQQVKLEWPLPVRIVIDISGDHDLSLNSARNGIILDEKWVRFEESLAFVICQQVSSSLTEEYWKKLKIILLEQCQSDQFTAALNKF